MIIFNTDLDNVLIFSAEHDIGSKKRCIEIYKGREIGFITERTIQLLEQIRKRILVVPITTRSVEQYRRIDLGFVPEYALVCNGSVLLKDGRKEECWYQKSLQLLTDDCTSQLSMAEEILEQDNNLIFEIRNIQGLFIVTKSTQPLLSVNRLRERLDTGKVDIFHKKQKVYIISKKLNKGMAVKRLRKKLHADFIIAAGDSEIDISMFQEANFALAPKDLKKAVQLSEQTILMDDNKVFSEAVLKHVSSVLQIL